MTVKIGVIGPQDSIDLIKSVAKSMDDDFELVLGIYDRKDETVKLTKKIQIDVDVLLYTGNIPYRVAVQSGVITKPALYVPMIGTSLTRILWDIKDRGLSYKRLSIDTINLSDVLEIEDELGIDFKKIKIIDFNPEESYENLAKKHAELVRNNETDVAITGLSTTYRILQEKGIHSYRIRPTIYLLKEHLQKALYIGDAKKQRSSQVNVMIFKLHCDECIDYKFLKLRNRFEHGLIELANKVFGTVFPQGQLEFMLFATRGVVETEQMSYEVLETLSKITNNFSGGLGYGHTVYRAEMNARMALNRAMAHEGACLYKMEMDGRLEGPFREGQFTLNYQLQETDDYIKEIAGKIGLSTAYIGKIESIIRRTSNNRFSAEEFASSLDISPRSARRILNKIVDNGFAEVVAHESPNKTGRPRQIFSIDFYNPVK
ncbi:MAG: hypothetical protein H0S78_03395 [Tissierellales bacterium]|nr:hypothetical protein [Tissierellales bacterium]